MLKCCAGVLALCGFKVTSLEERIEDLEDEIEELKLDLKDAKMMIYDLQAQVRVKTLQPNPKKAKASQGLASADGWDKYVQPKVVHYAPATSPAAEDEEKDYKQLFLDAIAKKNAANDDW